MRDRAFAAGAALGLALLLPVGAAAQAPSGDTLARIDRVFGRYGNATPGCALGVARDGREVVARGYGLAELEHRVPVASTTVFEAGSVSKQFTAFMVLLLEQDGRLSLDDPLRKHLPELPDYGAPLTIRQVLAHTSGLRDWYGLAEMEGRVAGEHHFTKDDVLRLASRQRTLNFASGSEYLYSNTGWILLAIVIERISGESFQRFAERRVFEPLGMTSTRWRDDFRAMVPGRAPAYAPRGSGWQHENPFSSIIGSGGLLTTVHDLLRWNENLTTGRVGGRALVERMATRSRLTDGREIAYGLGLRVAPARGTTEVSHSGSTGGYRAFAVRYPARGLSIAILCNEAGANPTAYARGVADVFLGAEPAVAQARPPLAPGDAAAVAGQYRRRTGEPAQVEVRDGVATAGGIAFTVAERDGARPRRLVGVDAAGDTVVLERADPWMPTGRMLDEFVGQYASDEAAPWRVVRADSGLRLEGPFGRRVTLRPVYADVFVAPGLGHVRFHRDRAGRVVTAAFLMGRIRELRLERTGAR